MTSAATEPALAPTLVLLPGMDGTGELFSRFTTALAAVSPRLEARVIRYPATRKLNYADLCELVREQLPTDRPYGLLAESFSGPVGIELAARTPPGLDKLILCCTFARCPRPAMRLLRPLISLRPLSAMPLPVLGRFLMGRHFERPLQKMLADAVAQVAPDVMQDRLLSVLEVDVSERLRQIQVPTLSLRAAQDRVVPRSASEELQTIKTDLQMTELPGPHFLLQTQAKEAAREVERFLSAR